ncbi:uncharacterized protein LOC125369504 [Ricinus communis]|uniref:uncharacterized protein LOC125369504 n=1 Tax=Ricinus communis TaxID=3988 RepID=UPI00201A923E|nr:uncharacterized protein LOC125369504 [Ricinus communis]
MAKTSRASEAARVPKEVRQLQSEVVKDQPEASKPPRKERGRSRDVVSDMDARLAKVELTVAEGQDTFWDLVQRIGELENGREELQEGMQAALNEGMSKCQEQAKTVEKTLLAEVVTLREILDGMVVRLLATEEELILCKKAAIQGNGSVPMIVSTPSKLDVPKPKAYKGSRNAKEIDNFLWNLEQYFKALGLIEEAKKVDAAALFLEDTAMLWWRRRSGDIENGICTIDSWGEFKKELKKQIYPENAIRDARAKLRRLSHTRSIKEYVKEFTDTLLEIPNYTDEEALFAFTDGLQIWARLELESRGVQDLNTAIAVAESLIEIRRQDKHKPDQERNGNGKNGGDRHHKKEGSYRFDKPIEGGNHGNKDDKGGEKPRIKCFFYDGPHKARECPTKNKLSALVEEREEHQRVQEESKMGSLQLLSAIKTKFEMPKSEKKGRLFVEAKVGSRTVEALIDTGANNNLLEVKEAERLGIKYAKEQGWLKAVNSAPNATCGFARDVKVSLGNTCMVPLKREAKVKAMKISAMQLSERVEKAQPSFLAVLKEEVATLPQDKVPKEITGVLDEFGNVMPAELPKKLPSKREVDQKMELVEGTRPLTAVPHSMAPLEFEELRRQPKELLDASHTRSSSV